MNHPDDARSDGASDATLSQPVATPASPKTAPSTSADLLQQLLWSVPETAFLLRVSVRTLRRMMADPRSHFPQPRRIGTRVLFARDEVLAHLGLDRPTPPAK
ncbi:MAG: helix-turn-helix domain-containing protein [Planctomycetes bacterium]|nr:helix-turn-helix domain-containing protein [Planctomycetota bacterium]